MTITRHDLPAFTRMEEENAECNPNLQLRGSGDGRGQLHRVDPACHAERIYHEEEETCVDLLPDEIRQLIIERNKVKRRWQRHRVSEPEMGKEAQPVDL